MCVLPDYSLTITSNVQMILFVAGTISYGHATKTHGNCGVASCISITTLLGKEEQNARELSSGTMDKMDSYVYNCE